MGRTRFTALVSNFLKYNNPLNKKQSCLRLWGIVICCERGNFVRVGTYAGGGNCMTEKSCLYGTDLRLGRRKLRNK